MVCIYAGYKPVLAGQDLSLDSDKLEHWIACSGTEHWIASCPTMLAVSPSAEK